MLKVLTSCQAGGSYEFKGVTPVHDKVSIENENDLYARLPLGVTSLKADLASSQRLDLDYVAVGQRETAKPPAMLQGACEGATHYVRTIMVGAYGLDAIGKAKVSGSIDVAGKGGGGEHSDSVRRLRGSGDVTASSAPDAKAGECGAVLQLGLAPLMVGGGGSVTAAGFGAGLGSMAVVPTVQEMTTLPGGGQSLAAADIALLKLLQEAKRADKAQASFEQRAQAWNALGLGAQRSRLEVANVGGAGRPQRRYDVQGGHVERLVLVLLACGRQSLRRMVCPVRLRQLRPQLRGQSLPGAVCSLTTDVTSPRPSRRISSPSSAPGRIHVRKKDHHTRARPPLRCQGTFPPRGHGRRPNTDAALRALDESSAASQDIPVSVALAEIASLVRLARSQQAHLPRIGLPPEMIDPLARHVARLGVLEKAWAAARSGVRLTARQTKLRKAAKVALAAAPVG